MLGKVKLYFGIEGLKMDLEIPEAFSLQDQSIPGTIRLHSKSAQAVSYTHLDVYKRQIE